MVHQRKARLAGGNAALRWLADPVVAVPDTALSGLYASVLAAPRVIAMAALTSAAICITAALRTGERAFLIFLLLDLTVLALRLRRFHRARRTIRAGRLPAIEPSMLLSLV